MSANYGHLTIFSADRSEIYGEFADALWHEEVVSPEQRLFILSGTAGEGTRDTFARLNNDGIEHVSFDYIQDGRTTSGAAILLRPTSAPPPGGSTITIETTTPLMTPTTH